MSKTSKVATNDWTAGAQSVPLRLIQLDKRFQARAQHSFDAVADYAEEWSAGGADALPPVRLVVIDNAPAAVVVDGWHRVMAAERAGFTSIRAEVLLGDTALAFREAAAANTKHGVRRTNADKRMSVGLMLQAKPTATAIEVAAHCGVTRQFVYDCMEKSRAAQSALADAQYTRDLEVARGSADDTAVDKLANTARQTRDIERVIACVVGAQAQLDALFEADSNRDDKNRSSVYVNKQAVEMDLRNAITSLRAAKPYSTCTVCGGVGCRACRNTGWLSVGQYKLLPRTQASGAENVL